jgi:MoaA/NifB/PqqE/SkfB family radical SAM enzyme
MCDAASSSLIAKEKWNNYKEGWWHKSGNSKDSKKKIWADYKQAGLTDELQWWQNPAFYEKIKENAKHIRTLKFTGGEPTLIPQVHEVMDYMLETGHSSHIELSLTTNGTYKGTDIYEKMCQFKSAKINLSVDGTDANYDYIRYPHTWKQWTRNTKQMLLFASDMNISYQFTVSVFNLFNIREFEKWVHGEGRRDLINYHSNFVYRPKWQNTRFLPDDTIQRAVDYLEGGDKIAKDAIKHITNGTTSPKELQWGLLKYDTELKDRLRPKRPNWDTIDNNMLRLKDLFHGR